MRNGWRLTAATVLALACPSGALAGEPATVRATASGLCVLIGFSDAGKALEIARDGSALVHCLFADEAALRQFSTNPDQYIAAALQAMQARR